MAKPILTTLELAHLPPNTTVHVALYDNVRNTRYLRKQLVEQNKDFEYAFIDARKIFSTKHVLAAVFRAVNDQANDRLRSHNVHSEIVVSLNITNNINDGFRKFGISDQTSSLLVVKVLFGSSDGKAIADQLEHAVDGEPREFSDSELAKVHDLAEIRRIYKLNATASKGKQTNAANSPSVDDAEIETAILSSIALRGAT